jgi:hypothetical protein
MFVHHVYFWLNDPANNNDRAQLKSGLDRLLTIKPYVMAHVGVPAGTSRGVIDSTYDFSLLLVFENEQDEAAYQFHPVHDDFRNNYAHLWAKVVVYDSVD